VPQKKLQGTRSMLRAGALLSTTGVVALAFAVPAHADDQSPPAPLMVSSAATVVPDEPDAVAAPVDPPQPEVSPPVAAPAPGWHEVIAPNRRGNPVKQAPTRHSVAQRVQYQPVRRAPSAAISTPRAHTRHSAARVAPRAERRRPAVWYQAARPQYRPRVAAAATRVSNTPVPAAAQPAVAPAAAMSNWSGNNPFPCLLTLRKCVDLCGADSGYNVSWNDRWIVDCVSTSRPLTALDTLHTMVLQRVQSSALSGRLVVTALRYQCWQAQYQAAACRSGRAVPVSAAPAAVSTRRGAESVLDRPGRSTASFSRVAARNVLAAVAVRRVARATAPTTRATHAPVRVREAAAGSRTSRADGFDRWWFRMVVLLTAAVALALLVALASGSTTAAAAVTGLRSRAGSRGLSGSRVDLGGRDDATDRPRSAIPYRE
jgi:hypothetical protein